MGDVPVGVVVGLASAIFTAVVTEVYCHRCLAHRAFRVHPILALLFDTYVRVIVGTDPESWAAVHRLHHRYADTPLDPHSPLQRRPLAVLLGSPYLFAVARRRVPPGVPSGKWIVAIRSLVVAFYLVMFGPVQVVIMLSVHLICYLGVMGMVNTVGHLHGLKPHPEYSGFDLAWLAIPLLGHGYHNSHHAHPAAARTGLLDPIWPLLRLLDASGLVELGARTDKLPAKRCCGATAVAASSRPREPDPGVVSSKTVMIEKTRHNTFHRRMRFAVPVVVIAAFGSGCGSDDRQAVTNPPPPVSTDSSSTTTPMTVVTPRPPPTEPGSTVIIANPPPPTTTVGPRVIANPPPPAGAGGTDRP